MRSKKNCWASPTGLWFQHGAVSRGDRPGDGPGIRSLCGADIGVSTTGIAGPGGGTAEKPVGLDLSLRLQPWRKRCLNFTWPGSPPPCGRDIRYMASSHALYQALLTARMKP